MFLKTNSDFSEQNDRCPVLVEIVPPEQGYEEKRLEEHTEYLTSMFQEVTVDAINIPEIQDESKKGDKGKRISPFKKRVTPRDYARALSGRFNTDFIINRVIVKEKPEVQERWLLDTYNEYGIKNVVFVGGESPEIKYPGPSVPDGSKMVKQFLNQGKLRYNKGDISPMEISVGNICIPNRLEEELSEADRMFFKYNAGADFFTTQIISEADIPMALMKDFSEKLEKQGGNPPSIFWSFSPISSQKDIDFLRWLGVYIPDAQEKQIMESDDPAAASLQIIESAWEQMLDYNRQLPVPLPMGINVSVMGKRNYEHGIQMAKNLNSVSLPD